MGSQILNWFPVSFYPIFKCESYSTSILRIPGKSYLT